MLGMKEELRKDFYRYVWCGVGVVVCGVGVEWGKV